MPEMRFHYLARGIILNKGKLLLARQVGAAHTFLPGGHIEIGEGAEAALLREIEEETGIKATVKGFIGAVECTWGQDDQRNHEINLLFELQVPGLEAGAPPASQESQLEFLWASPAELKSFNLLPEAMIACLQNWEQGFHGYWGSSF